MNSTDECVDCGEELVEDDEHGTLCPACSPDRLLPDGGTTDSQEQHNGPKFTGEDAEERLLLCVKCERYVELWPSGEPKCAHTDDEARTLDGLTDAEWANIRLWANKRELGREGGPRAAETVLQSNVMSLASDLAWAGELEEPPKDLRDGGDDDVE
jgi:hypothetical protein